MFLIYRIQRFLIFPLLLLLFLFAFANTSSAQSDITVRKLTVKDRGMIDGRGGLPLYWDGFIFGQYAGTARDCIYYNYTGSGHNILNLLADGAAVCTLNKAGNLVLTGTITAAGISASTSLPDIDSSNSLNLLWAENDTANRNLWFRVFGGNRFLHLNESFTIGNGAAGTLTFTNPFTLTVSGNSLIDQDLRTVASPTFNGLTLSGLNQLRLASTTAGGVFQNTDLFGWIAGTANQITIADDGDGTVTFSTPQNIHTGASPTFAGTTLSGLTASRLLASDGAKALVSSDLNNWVTQTANQVLIADDGDGTITFSAPQDIAATSDVTFGGANIGGGVNFIDIAAGGVLTMQGAATVDGVPAGNLLDKTAGETITGLYTHQVAGNALILQNTTDAVSNQVAIFRSGNRATPAANDEGYITFQNDDSTGTQAEFSRMTWKATDIVNTTKDSMIKFETMVNNNLTKTLTLKEGKVSIGSADSTYLLYVYGTPTSGVMAVFKTSSDLRNGISVYNNTWYTQFGTYESTNANYAGANSGFLASEAGLSLFTQGATPMVFATNGNINTGINERMRIGATGNVGIGTTGPDRKLDVLDASNPQIRMTHTDGTVFAELQADGNGDLNISASGDEVKINEETVFTPSDAQVIDAVGDTILANATTIILNPDANYTMTSAPTIANGSAGQIVYIITAGDEPNTVEVQDQDSLADSNLQLGAAGRTIGANDVLILHFNGMDWCEVHYQDN